MTWLQHFLHRMTHRTFLFGKNRLSETPISPVLSTNIGLVQDWANIPKSPFFEIAETDADLLDLGAAPFLETPISMIYW